MIKLPVLIATCNTPLVTSLTVCSYKLYNIIDSEIHIGSAVNETKMHKIFNIVSLTEKTHQCNINDHGYILNQLYKDCVTENDSFFLIVDSDIEFLKHGYVEKMINLLKSNKNHYCATSGHLDFAYDIYYPRIQPFVCLFRNDKMIQRAMRLIGMSGCRSQTPSVYNPKTCTYDVASLISNCMDVAGRTVGVLPDDNEFNHLSGSSHRNRNNQNHLNYCFNKLKDYINIVFPSPIKENKIGSLAEINNKKVLFI